MVFLTQLGGGWQGWGARGGHCAARPQHQHHPLWLEGSAARVSPPFVFSSGICCLIPEGMEGFVDCAKWVFSIGFKVWILCLPFLCLLLGDFSQAHQINKFPSFASRIVRNDSWPLAPRVIWWEWSVGSESALAVIWWTVRKLSTALHLDSSCQEGPRAAAGAGGTSS